MNKKQTKRTKQPKQSKKTKKSKEVLENESDDNIEMNSELEEEYIEPEEPVLKAKKKRNISEEQKKVLVDRLAYARSLRKKESENKKVLENEYLQQKEQEINDRLLKKFTSLQRIKENEMMKKYLSKPKEESDEEPEEQEIIIKKKKPPQPKKKVIYRYEEDDEDRYIPPTPAPTGPSICFC